MVRVGNKVIPVLLKKLLAKPDDRLLWVHVVGGVSQISDELSVDGAFDIKDKVADFFGIAHGISILPIVLPLRYQSLTIPTSRRP